MRGSARLSDAYRLLRQQKVLRGAWNQADVRGSTLLPLLPTVHAGNRLRTREVTGKLRRYGSLQAIRFARRPAPRPSMRSLNLALLTHAMRGRGEKHAVPAWGAYRVLYRTSQPLCPTLKDTLLHGEEEDSFRAIKDTSHVCRGGDERAREGDGYKP